MSPIAAVVACSLALLGLAVGARVRVALAAGHHRRPTDDPAPLPPFAWLPAAVGLGVAVPGALASPAWQDALSGERPGVPLLVLALVGAAAVLAGAVASAVDLDVHRLPDRLTLPAATTAAALLALATATGEPVGSLVRALTAGLVLGGVYLLLSFLTAGGIGLGDVKLALAVGTLTGWMGWGPFLLAAWGAFAVGALWAALLMVLGRATRRTHLPFGPAMVVSAWATWCLWLGA